MRYVLHTGVAQACHTEVFLYELLTQTGIVSKTDGNTYDTK